MVYAKIASMTSLPTLTKQQARNLMLKTLGLASPPRHKARKADILSVVRQIHNLQIDTISVAARAHLHILWSRLGAYNPAWLDDLHAEGHLFEYFAHAMCYLPIEDYPVWRHTMINGGGLRQHNHAWARENRADLDNMLAHIRESGPVRSADFDSKDKRGAWWDWKHEKDLMEYLFYTGELMVCRRQGFQRVYDLRQRVLPDWDDARLETAEEVVRRKVLNAAQALGVATESWLANYFYLKKTDVRPAVKTLVEEGHLLPVRVAGIAALAYTHAANQPLLEQALAGRLRATHTTILSMFDPLMTDRQRARDLFDFDYTIEVYVPAPKRVYGYYVLPILHRGKLVGRLDMKTWRKEKRLQVFKVFLEPGVQPDDGLTSGLAAALRGYADWQGLADVSVDWSEPAGFADKLNVLLS